MMPLKRIVLKTGLCVMVFLASAHTAMAYQVVVSNRYATSHARIGPIEFTKHTVDGDVNAVAFVHSADVDGDGDIDVIGAALDHSPPPPDNDVIVWWENMDGSGTNWREHTVVGSFGVYQVRIADIDRDGAIDILGTAYQADAITWWENDLEILATFPAPLWTNAMNASLELNVVLPTDTVMSGSRTQFVCTGWARMGSAPGSGSDYRTGYFALTNDATLLFQWVTNVMFSVQANEGGTIAGDSNGWYALGSTATVTGVPYAYCAWTGWTGAVETVVNPLTLTNDRASRLWATFAQELATNGTPKWWLVQYGWTNDFDLWTTNDTDGDNMLAWQEYVAGTVPTNPLSVFEITGFELVTGAPGYMIIRWPSVGGRCYTVSATTNLSDAFTPFTNDITATPMENVYTDSVGNAQQVFYRIEVEKQ